MWVVHCALESGDLMSQVQMNQCTKEAIFWKGGVWDPMEEGSTGILLPSVPLKERHVCEKKEN